MRSNGYLLKVTGETFHKFFPLHLCMRGTSDKTDGYEDVKKLRENHGGGKRESFRESLIFGGDRTIRGDNEL